MYRGLRGRGRRCAARGGRRRGGAPAGRIRRLSRRQSHSRRGARHRGGGHPPRLRIPRRERQLRERRGGGGPGLGGPHPRGHRTHGRQAGRQGAGDRIGRTHPSLLRRHQRCQGPGLSAAGEGGRGRRRQGHADREGTSGPPGGRGRGETRGREFLRRRSGLFRALRDPRASRGDPDPGRSARQDRAPWRARVLDPASPPEDPGGVAVASPRSGTAQRHGRCGAEARAGVGLPIGGHRRVPGRRRLGRVLLPRGEYPTPGGAPPSPRR